MLRPERMSKVSVTGTKRVMDDVIETVHDLNRVHITEYDDSWSGFEPGDPIEGADEISEKLVTIRSLENILDLDPEDAGPAGASAGPGLDTRLEEVRTEVNELDDRRSELREELRRIEERIEVVEPFVDLGIDLDLLSGYDSLSVAVGEAEESAVEAAVSDLDCPVETFAGRNLVAVFARTDEAELDDVLVGAEFREIDVPNEQGPPGTFVDELEHERDRIEKRVESIEAEIEELKLDAGGFLLTAEERLSIDVQKAEAPLSFATTENAFIAEGWIPTSEYDRLQSALSAAVGDSVELDELERASYTGSGVHHDEEVATDGGMTVDDQPPVLQDTPSIASPFEVLVRAVGRPKYSEFDPTVVLLLTFPTFFGFMIGDVGYGAVYALIGYYLYSRFESDAISSMGGVGMWAGGFTILFGILYGELFGLHMGSTPILESIYVLDAPPLHKGLQPAEAKWAQTWLFVSVLVAVFHLDIGYVLDFAELYDLHGAKDAILETGSWLLMMNGFWLFVFSRIATGKKPAFLFTVFDGTGTAPEASGEHAGAVIELGFNGFSSTVGWIGLGAFVLGLLFIWVSREYGEAIEASFMLVLTNGLSYTRLAAVLLAKAGMAFVVNLLFFGAYEHDGEFHFMMTDGPQHFIDKYGEAAIMFPGLIHGGIASLIGGFVVLILGHAVVLVLGLTSAGLQAVRLEYYEFFSKFYEGGGEPYDPFGYDRSFTAEE
ncbi:MAG: V-type ATP synthase subunit I [Halobacteriales archaeon]